MTVTKSDSSRCFDLGGKPLRVFAAGLVTNSIYPVDGVVRNVAFTNTATNTIIKSPCAVPTDSQAVLFLSSFRKANKPMVLGLNGRSLSHFQSFISYPSSNFEIFRTVYQQRFEF